MPKYYVSSGSVSRVIDRPTQLAALRDILHSVGDCLELGTVISVNEHGFDSENETHYYTIHLLEEFGLLG